MKTLVICSLVLIACAGRAQNFTIDWFSIDGGGGTSTGGVYTLSGTIGQPDAGTMAGGNYTLVGGFWGIVDVIQTPGAPPLAISRNTVNGTVTVYWPKPADGWVLDQSAALTAAWSQVPFPYQTNATDISITIPSPAGNKFYRLRK